MHALALVGPVPAQVAAPGPRAISVRGYPTAGYDVEYSMLAVTTVRTEAAAEDSLAAILARSRFGMAIAAMIRMIATTISNSINEKPFCLRICVFSLLNQFSNLGLSDSMPLLSHFPRHFANYESSSELMIVTQPYVSLTALWRQLEWFSR